MKRGLDLEDPESMDDVSPQSSRRYHNDWFAHWDNLSQQRARSYQREQRTFRSFDGDAGRTKDWFGFLQEFQFFLTL